MQSVRSLKRFIIIADKDGVGLNRLLLTTSPSICSGRTPVRVSSSCTAAKHVTSNSRRACAMSKKKGWPMSHGGHVVSSPRPLRYTMRSWNSMSSLEKSCVGWFVCHVH